MAPRVGVWGGEKGLFMAADKQERNRLVCRLRKSDLPPEQLKDTGSLPSARAPQRDPFVSKLTRI